MGLTIYYELGSDEDSLDAAHSAMKKLWEKSQSLPFQSVSELEFLSEFETRELVDEVERVKYGGAAFYLHQISCSAQNPELQATLGKHQFHTVHPECSYHFTVDPGDGSESASIGLSRFPPTTIVEDKEWETGLCRWHWHSFCKTQYASNPKYGGVDHFLNCHLSLIELFDFADSIGILRRVADDGGYWETRDKGALSEQLTNLNRIVASVTGAMKDAADGGSSQIQSPISDYPNFEHLEAEGRSTTTDNDDELSVD